MILAATESSTHLHTASLLELQGLQARVLASHATALDPDLGEESAEVWPGILLEAAALAGLRLRDVAAFAVGIGPGPYRFSDSAIRTVRGIALANRRPFLGVSSLEALAEGAAHVSALSGLMVPVIADGSHLLCGFFRSDFTGALRRSRPEERLALSALQARLAGMPDAMGFGSGYLLHRQSLRAFLPELPGAPAQVHASMVGRLAARQLGALPPYNPLLAFRVEPVDVSHLLH